MTKTYEVVMYATAKDFDNYNGFVLEYGLSKASACLIGVEALASADVIKIQSNDREDITIFQRFNN